MKMYINLSRPRVNVAVLNDTSRKWLKIETFAHAHTMNVNISDIFGKEKPFSASCVPI